MGVPAVNPLFPAGDVSPNPMHFKVSITAHVRVPAQMLQDTLAARGFTNRAKPVTPHFFFRPSYCS